MEQCTEPLRCASSASLESVAAEAGFIVTQQRVLFRSGSGNGICAVVVRKGSVLQGVHATMSSCVHVRLFLRVLVWRPPSFTVDVSSLPFLLLLDAKLGGM